MNNGLSVACWQVLRNPFFCFLRQLSLYWLCSLFGISMKSLAGWKFGENERKVFISLSTFIFRFFVLRCAEPFNWERLKSNSIISYFVVLHISTYMAFFCLGLKKRIMDYAEPGMATWHIS